MNRLPYTVNRYDGACAWPAVNGEQQKESDTYKNARAYEHKKEDTMNVCMYFQVHQPFRLRKFTIFDIGKSQAYFDEAKNKEVMQKVARKCYLPTNKVMLDLINKHGSHFKINYSITGCALEQFALYAPEVLESFQTLADTGNVEFLGETYYHSLACMFDQNEFLEQIEKHERAIKELFGQKPTVFRNTELIYHNHLSSMLEHKNYAGILAEGADHVLRGKSPNAVYKTKIASKLLLKNYRLSDDVAFRFGDSHRQGSPLTPETYASWIAASGGVTANLFMDYETFGEHQWADTGIFTFLQKLPQACLNKGLGFHTASDAAKLSAESNLDIPTAVSWADTERDLSAWLGNKIQQAAALEVYKLKTPVFATEDPFLIDAWRKLTTSDHLYYMCTKWFNDGDVHKYFNPYNSPYECYIAFMNILQDVKQRTAMEEQEWLKIN